MASPAYVSFMTEGKPIEGSVVQPGKQGTSLVIAFKHAVLFTGTELFTGNPVREHKPVLLIKELDKSSITLYQLLTRGAFIEKATIDWYRFNEKSKKDEIYFQHILEKVKITSIRLIMPHIKNPQFERNVHMEEVALRYDRIAWVYPEGNIRYTDRWLYAFLLGGMNKSEQKEWDALMGKEAATDDFADWLDERKKEKQVVKIHLVDSNNNILAEVKITLDNGDEYDTDANGDVKIELKDDQEDVTVTKIELPGKPSEQQTRIKIIDLNNNPIISAQLTLGTGEVFETDKDGIVILEESLFDSNINSIRKIEFQYIVEQVTVSRMQESSVAAVPVFYDNWEEIQCVEDETYVDENDDIKEFIDVELCSIEEDDIFCKDFFEDEEYVFEEEQDD